MKRKTILLFCGVSGSGKSFYGRYMSTNSRFLYVSSGDLVRDIHKNLSENERKFDVNHINVRGTSVYNVQIEKRINKFICRNDFVILDGYPRTVSQVESIIQNFGDNKIICVKFFVDIGICLNRIKGRNDRDDIKYDYKNIINSQIDNMNCIKKILIDSNVPYCYIDGTMSKKEVQNDIEKICNVFS